MKALLSVLVLLGAGSAFALPFPGPGPGHRVYTCSARPQHTPNRHEWEGQGPTTEIAGRNSIANCRAATGRNDCVVLRCN